MLRRCRRTPAIRLRGPSSATARSPAVDGLDLDVPMGTCVGPLVRMAPGSRRRCGSSRPSRSRTRARSRCLGSSSRESKQARAQLSVAPQLDNLDTTLTVEQNLLVFCTSTGSTAAIQGAIERALVMAKLVERRGDRVDKLSGGMRRRLLIARSLIHRPRLVLMDEPTVGLDPQVRQALGADRSPALRRRRSSCRPTTSRRRSGSPTP